MRSEKVIVIGSTNMDMVVQTNRIPAPGETVLAGSFFMNPGGKGANQAVAVARLGGEVSFVTKVGNDVFGKQFFQLFSAEGIDTSYLLFDKDLSSGVALITVDKAGENSIVVAPGANGHLSVADLELALTQISSAAVVLLQLEIPMETVHFGVEYAYSRGLKVILNPAPAGSLSPQLLRKIDILTPNATEAGILAEMTVTDRETAKAAAMRICNQGVKDVIITMGSLGAVVCNLKRCIVVDAPRVESVDTTAAGDVFNGALAVALAKGDSLESAARFACKAASVSVTRLGA